MPQTPSTERWTFTERATALLDLAAEIDTLRLGQSGIDISASFHWQLGGNLTSSIADLDNDDFRSFLTAWRQLVMRNEATHLPTILELCATHLTHPVLRDLAATVAGRLAQVNGNDTGELHRMTFTFTYGSKVYSPWELADLFMHGAIFHRDRAKRAVLESLPPDVLAQIEWAFRLYVDDVLGVLSLARAVLAKAVEKGYVSDQPIDAGVPGTPDLRRGD